MADLALRPLSLGELLDRAFTIFRQRFGAIALVLLACLAFPTLLMTNNIRSMMELARQSQTSGNPEAAMSVMFAMMGKMFLMALVFGVAMVVARGAIGWVAHKAMLGDEIGAWDAIAHGFKTFLPMFGLLIMEVIIFIGAEIVFYIPLIAFGFGSALSGARPGAGFGLGMVIWLIAFAIGMLYVVACLFVTNAVLVAEIDGGVFRSLQRSWDLTRDRRGNIMGMLLLLYVLLWVVMMGVSFGMGIAIGMSGKGVESMGAMMVGVFGLMGLISMFVMGYYYVLQMTTYYDLRVRKEGLDLELASAAMPPA